MNMFRNTLLAALLGSTALAAAARSDDVIIVLSPYGEEEAVKDRGKKLIGYALKTVQPGEKAVFFDGANLRGLCNFAVPDKSVFKHERAKLKVNGKCVKAVLEFHNAPDADHGEGSLDLAGLFAHLGRNYNMETIGTILVAGSPIYHDPHQPRESMRAARVASDGHIEATRTASPFGTAGLSGILKDTPVHFATVSDWALNERHGELVERFWTLQTEALGGRMASFSGDLDRVLQRAIEGAAPVPHGHTLESGTKLEMMPVRIERFSGPPVFQRELTTGPASPDVIRAAQSVEIGIRWTNCPACDIDLHVTPYRGAQTLYFASTHSAEGRFFKDFTSAPTHEAGLESVFFGGPIDFTKLQIAVNFFRGTAPEGVKGEVRIAIGDETYAAPFSIAATKGNAGAGRTQVLNTGTAVNNHWTIINPLAVLGQR